MKRLYIDVHNVENHDSRYLCGCVNFIQIITFPLRHSHKDNQHCNFQLYLTIFTQKIFNLFYLLHFPNTRWRHWLGFIFTFLKKVCSWVRNFLSSFCDWQESRGFSTLKPSSVHLLLYHVFRFTFDIAIYSWCHPL